MLLFVMLLVLKNMYGYQRTQDCISIFHGLYLIFASTHEYQNKNFSNIYIFSLLLLFTSHTETYEVSSKVADMIASDLRREFRSDV